MRAVILVATLLLASSVCEGAVLLRFINTVPTRASTVASNQPLSTSKRLTNPHFNQDRVGLQYFADAVTAASTVQSPTIVFTELVTDVSGDTAPFAWTHAMPALRQYHTTTNGAAATTETNAVDRVSVYATGVAVNDVPAVDAAAAAGNALAAAHAANDDNYEQTMLKADGVGLYLSFAPGTYRMQAYAVRAGADIAASRANPLQALTLSSSQFTFEDNKVYTLVAIGDGRYSAVPTPLVGNDVTLRLFEESTASTTFGKAAIRWFHAVRNFKTDTISVFLGDTASAPAIAANIPFGGLSNYVDVTPATRQIFPVTASSTGSAVIAPTSGDRTEVTHDIRAGLRATIICAVNNDVDNRVFCRMIPSRVVAYVRLVNDLAALNSLTLGAVGSTPVSRTSLTLWASYEFPRPDQVAELSQTGGDRAVTNTPANVRGLYRVVSNVAVSTVSGYGEVFVPIHIMDFAIRFTIIRDTVEIGTGSAGTAAGTQNQLTPTADAAAYSWFWGAPIHKRVHFIVKTAGRSTIGGTADAPVRVPTLGWHANSRMIDRFVEVGAFYTFIVTPLQGLGVGGAAATGLTAAVAAPTSFGVLNGGEVRFFWRIDRTVDDISAGVPSGSATFTNVNFAEQTAPVITLRPKASGNGNLVTPARAVAATGAGSQAVLITAAPSTIAAETSSSTVDVTVRAGEYSFDAPGADRCDGAVPGSTDVTFAAGDMVSLFVLNRYGCQSNSLDQNRLLVTPVKAQSALQTGHAAGTLLSPGSPSSPPTFFLAAAPALSVSMSVLVAAIFAAVAALL